MYRIVGDIGPRSFWLVTTPSASQRTMPYLCTEAGTLYGKRRFLTERVADAGSKVDAAHRGRRIDTQRMHVGEN